MEDLTLVPWFDPGSLVRCRDRGGKKQIEVVCEGVLIFRGLPDRSSHWVNWVACLAIIGLLIAFLMI